MGLPLRSTYTNDRMKPYETQRKSQEQERNLKKDSRLELITKKQRKEKRKGNHSTPTCCTPKVALPATEIVKKNKKIKEKLSKNKEIVK